MQTCAYINLPTAKDRRDSVEASFAAAETAGDRSLRRFEAPRACRRGRDPRRDP